MTLYYHLYFEKPVTAWELLTIGLELTERMSGQLSFLKGRKKND